MKRPARPTTPISQPKLAELVADLRTPEPDPAATFELPTAESEDENIIEMTVDDERPAAKPTRNAHVVRRPK